MLGVEVWWCGSVEAYGSAIWVEVGYGGVGFGAALLEKPCGAGARGIVGLGRDFGEGDAFGAGRDVGHDQAGRGDDAAVAKIDVLAAVGGAGLVALQDPAAVFGGAGATEKVVAVLGCLIEARPGVGNGQDLRAAQGEFASRFGKALVVADERAKAPDGRFKDGPVAAGTVDDFFFGRFVYFAVDAEKPLRAEDDGAVVQHGDGRMVDAFHETDDGDEVVGGAPLDDLVCGGTGDGFGVVPMVLALVGVKVGLDVVDEALDGGLGKDDEARAAPGSLGHVMGDFLKVLRPVVHDVHGDGGGEEGGGGAGYLVRFVQMRSSLDSLSTSKN